MKTGIVIAGLLMVGAGAVLIRERSAAGDDPVPLYDNLGTYHRPITTSEPRAQRYFDQGLRLTYAFNHAEAIRAFAEAERLDPDCAMCPWGIALAAGPNINAPMDSASGALAYAAVRRAHSKLGHAAPVEQALIRALLERYGEDPTAARAQLDSNYAARLATVATEFPDDPDVQVLLADALMNLSPWYYWENGRPRPGTETILASLSRALEADSTHPGACHFYIHAMEAQDPARAVPCAERLAGLMPGAGHLVHMPGHVYIRVGRYADAIAANQHAVHADETYFEGPQDTRNGLYGRGYYPHNYHFLSFAASMAGNGNLAIEAADKTVRELSADVMAMIPWVESVSGVKFGTLVTFARWDQILAEPLPDHALRYARAMAYYARAIAQAERGRWDEAAASLGELRTLVESFPPNDNRTALEIAVESVQGEFAMRRNQPARAVNHFRKAVALEDRLTYNEPPTWYYPVRHSLGKALLAAGNPAEAERVYREDLERFPENGWSLKGLELSLRAQGRTGEADSVRARFEQAWRSADVTLEGSRL